MPSGYRNEDVTVNTVATTPAGAEIAPARHGRRISYYVKNVSSGAAAAAIVKIVCADQITAVSGITGGYVLDPKEYLVDSNSEQYFCWQGRIIATSSVDGATISVSERVF